MTMRASNCAERRTDQLQDGQSWAGRFSGACGAFVGQHEWDLAAARTSAGAQTQTAVAANIIAMRSQEVVRREFNMTASNQRLLLYSTIETIDCSLQVPQRSMQPR
jgi:hypothetical protein